MPRYGLNVSSDRMTPELRRGSCALVDPGLPWRDGDTCAFRTTGEDAGSVLLGKLAGHTNTTWTVHQHTPPCDFDLMRSEWPVCHRIFGVYFASRYRRPRQKSRL